MTLKEVIDNIPKKISGVYKITSPSNKVYIGQSTNIRGRFIVYLRLECKLQIKLYNSLLKHGINSHKFEIIEICDKKYLNNIERYYQDRFNAIKDGLNLKYTEGILNKGKYSDESRMKMSKSKSGRKLSEETRLKMSNSHKQRNFTDEYKKKLSEFMKSRPISAETRKKLSDANKGKLIPIEQRSKTSKAVLKYDKNMNFIKEYYGLLEAERQTGVARQSIRLCSNGKLKSSGGFIWKIKTV